MPHKIMTMYQVFTSTMDLKLRKKLVKCYIWSTVIYGAETWTLRAVDQKHLESFEMWCWRRMDKISWTDHVRNEIRGKEQSNILHEISKRKANNWKVLKCGAGERWERSVGPIMQEMMEPRCRRISYMKKVNGRLTTGKF